jgi:hypothetical protein
MKSFFIFTLLYKVKTDLYRSVSLLAPSHPSDHIKMKYQCYLNNRGTPPFSGHKPPPWWCTGPARETGYLCAYLKTKYNYTSGNIQLFRCTASLLYILRITRMQLYQLACKCFKKPGLAFLLASAISISSHLPISCAILESIVA